MSPRLMIILTIVIAWSAIILVILAMIRRDGRKPAPAAQKHTPKHAATERIHAGGRYLATQPRRNSPPLTEQAIITSRPGRPWNTAANPALRQYDEHLCAVPDVHGKHVPYYCTVPAHRYLPNDDAETLALGGWGTMPAERVIAAELPQVIA